MKKITYLLVPILFAAFSSLPVSAEEQGTTLTSWGWGPKAVDIVAPSAVKTPKEKEKEAAGEETAEGYAARTALLIYLMEKLSDAEFKWLEEGIDSVILSSPEKFVLNTKLISSIKIPAAEYEIVKAEVTLNSDLIDTYIENIRKLKPMPKGPAPPTTSEKERFKSRGNEIFMQGEVASDIVFDHARGMEDFTEAMKLYEKADYDDGVFLALLSRGRTRLGIGDTTGARADLNKAMELADSLEKDEYRARTLLETARLHLLTGKYKKALESASSALEIASNPTAGEVPGALLGEALLIIGKANYLLGNRDGAKAGVDRAADVFQKLGDLKRINDALITLSIIRISTGDAPGAIEEIKLIKKISEALKDDESRIVSLILLGRALRETGELNGAKIYAEEAKAAAKKAKWKAGEAMADIELSLISTADRDYGPAISSATDALTLSIAVDSPALTAAAHRALGIARLGAGKKGEALGSFTEALRYSADTMSVELGGIYLPIETADIDGLPDLLTDIITISKELGEEETAFSALLTYQTIWQAIWLAERLDSSDPLIDEARRKLLSPFRKNIEELLVTERLLISLDANRYSESSNKTLRKKREELKSSLSEARKTIAREDPGLATLTGVEKREPKRLAKEIGEDSIFVQYFVGRDAAFALVTSRGDLEIIALDEKPEEIGALSGRMDTLLSGGGAAPPVDGTSSNGPGLSFEETSRRLTAALMTPVLSEYPGVKKIGVSPGIALGSLPFQALGDYRGENGFTFLIEEYDLFYAPSLFASVSTAEGQISAIDYLTVVGEGRFSPADVRWLFYEVVRDGEKMPAGGETVTVINDPSSRPWWELNPSTVVVMDPGGYSSIDGTGESGLFTMELFASYKNCPYIFVSGAAGDREITGFFEAAVPKMREAGLLSGYFLTMRESAVKYRESGSLNWVHFPIMCSF